jgi:hypothetical protein
MLRANDTEGLARLFKGKHISEKITKNREVIILWFGPGPGGPVEFRFPDNPTTYWTNLRSVTTNVSLDRASPFPSPASPSPSPAPHSTLPAGLPSSLAGGGSLPEVKPAPSPSPTSSPAASPTPQARIAVSKEAQEKEEEAPSAHPPLRRKHFRARDKEEGVPERAKVWHLVHGHWKWYDKRNLKEVRRALAVSESGGSPATALPAPVRAVAPPSPAPNEATPAPTPDPAPVSRGLPLKP